MAKKRFRLLDGTPEGFMDGSEPGVVFEDDFGYDTEKALVAAGWVEVVEENDNPKSSAKGGKS